MSKKIKVKENDFLSWYFADSDDVLAIANGIKEQLNFNGKFEITTQHLFDSCGYIPNHICDTELQREFIPEECMLIKKLSS